MKRAEIVKQLLGEERTPLWVPLLTHYGRKEGRVGIDEERMARHAAQVRPSIRSWLLAGSTGDGWDLSADQFEALLSFAARRESGEGVRVLMGTLRPTTAEVIAFIDKVHRAAGTSGSARLEDNVARLAARGWVGIAACPPVGEGVTQEAIIAHYRAICEAARMPLAVYQLPQVTRNLIEPATLATLVAAHEEIILFKDTSGEDAVARAGVGLEGVVLVRGAEGDYATMLKPLGGPYDGLLLSTGNGFHRQLRELVERVSTGDLEAARALDQELTGLVQRLFAAAGGAPVGNAFANANRAVDHVFAHGKAWREHAMPMLFDGSRLPDTVVSAIAALLEEAGLAPERGYLG